MSGEAPRRRRGGALLGVPIGLLLLAALLVGLWAISLRHDSGQASAPPDANGTATATDDGSVTLPDLTGPSPETPKTLTTSKVASRAAVWAVSEARRRPSVMSPVVGTLPTRTPEGTDNIVLALEERPDEAGRLWVRVRLAVRPNNTVGWVPRESLGPYATIRTRLIVSRRHLRATLWASGRKVFSAPVGIGKAGTPTPAGHFYIRNKLTKYANAFYGPIALGTSARAPTLTEWPAGGYVGIHGTNSPDLLPGRVSHGCIRMRNADIVRLAHLMVPGTPLEIR